ncbi:hypothetical protein ABZ883_14700 [Streptomyces sp. NPDC046977]|uniref:hypothetical protein n=1 Tax=Streptomyces sp. NPDC046977 TaxID=3154703 RepID=UPI00340D7E56
MNDKPPQPPGGHLARTCRHCWTWIRWVEGGTWTHVNRSDVGHTPEPPPLTAAP